MSCVWMLNDNDCSSEKAEVKYLPLFADIRTDLRFGCFTPFADLRMGCNLLPARFVFGLFDRGLPFLTGDAVWPQSCLGRQSSWLPFGDCR